MKDLFQSVAARDDFQQWLNLGTAPITISHGEKSTATLDELILGTENNRPSNKKKVKDSISALIDHLESFKATL